MKTITQIMCSLLASMLLPSCVVVLPSAPAYPQYTIPVYTRYTYPAYPQYVTPAYTPLYVPLNHPGPHNRRYNGCWY